MLLKYIISLSLLLNPGNSKCSNVNPELIIKPHKMNLSIHEDLIIDLKLSITSSCYYCDRLTYATNINCLESHCIPKGINTFFFIWTKDGILLEPINVAKGTEYMKRDFKKMSSGDSISSSINLRKFYGFLRPGVYIIQALYIVDKENIKEYFFSDINLRDSGVVQDELWTGAIVSNPVAIELFSSQQQ